jgi:hypothetical protein
MSFWTDIRDTVQSVASVAGNYFLPGSGAITSQLVSEGAQDQLGSVLGRVAMLGSGVAGGVGGNMSNYGKIFDAAGNMVNGTQAAASGLSGNDVIQQLVDGGMPFDQAVTQAQAWGVPGAGTAASMVGGAPAAKAGGTTNWTNYLTSPSVLGSVISGGAGLLGAGLQANAARQAAQGIADANITSNQLMARINEQNQARQEPFYQAGLSALPAYTQGVMPGGNLVRSFSLKDFIADPGQEYRTRMGLDAIQSSAVSRGLGRSGKTYLDLMRAGQEYATQGFGNRENAFYANQATQRNALASLTGFAPTASSAIQAGDTAYGSNAANLASNTANAMAGAGATRASSYGNALAGIGQNIYNTMNPDPMKAMMAQYMQNQMRG